MKKIRKGTQLKLTNQKNAGRRAIHDPGIRHTSRALISRPFALHLTIKLKKADIQNKVVLRILKHVHFYVECGDNRVLGKSM